MRTVRNYDKLVNEIINLNIPFKVEIIGYVQYKTSIYPILAIRRVSKIAKRNVVITSGIHGDEYFAVHVLLKWVQQIKLDILDEFNFHIFPVVNPYGYAKDYAKNGSNQEVNNANSFCKNSKVTELDILFDNFPMDADLVIDIHGDIDKSDVYAYEHKAESFPPIAEKALIENDTILPYIKTKTLYQVKLINGVCEDREETGIEGVAEKRGLLYSITLELPEKCLAQRRTAGGIAIMNSILLNFKDTLREEPK
jgi:predicted deacylase